MKNKNFIEQDDIVLLIILGGLCAIMAIIILAGQYGA